MNQRDNNVTHAQDIVSKWKRAEARERQSVQEHFIAHSVEYIRLHPRYRQPAQA